MRQGNMHRISKKRSKGSKSRLDGRLRDLIDKETYKQLMRLKEGNHGVVSEQMGKH